MKFAKKEPNEAEPSLRVLPTPEDGDDAHWLESLETVVEHVLSGQAPGTTTRFLDSLAGRLREKGVEAPRVVSTPYLNTIPVEKQAPFPGDWEMERRIKSYVRWNAMAMVVNANREHSGLGGHISTYASTATLYEVGFNHFFRGRTRRISPATWSISRATPRPAFTRARSWKAASTNSTCRISARNWPRAAGSPPIRIPT